MAESKIRPLILGCQLLVVLVALDGLRPAAEAVVVDGSRSGPSATNNQSHEREMIDRFNTKDCGIYDTDHDKSAFINAARPGEFPWIASLQTFEQPFCMGSFISDTWVLTAAHCFTDNYHATKLAFDVGKFTVVAGTTNVYSKHNKRVKVKRAFYHGLFDPNLKVGFDVGLLELTEPVPIKTIYDRQGPFINTVCLPIQGKEFKMGQAVKIAGWGLTEFENHKSAPDELLTTDLYITNATKCAEKFANKVNATIRKQFTEFKDLICADYHGKRDACQGDSGSPMLEFADGKAVAIGIVSYGYGCATKGWPGIYERVSSLMPWIKDITQNKEKAKVEHIMWSRDRDDDDDKARHKGHKDAASRSFGRTSRRHRVNKT